MLFGRLVAAAVLYSAHIVAAGNDGHGEHQKLVPGIAFDRFCAIWLENTNFADAVADPNFDFITKQGIQLTNYFATTHPSEPNYVAVVGGDNFGMQNDNLNHIPSNISSIVDLLEEKGISWAEYQEGMPESGFQGFSFSPSAANDYVRKHNPLIIYDSVALNPARSAKIKNFTLFEQDLKAGTIPQWMFITPNMTNDGHDTNVTFASKFARGFLEPLLNNPNFNGKKTLIVLTFDENDSSNPRNNIDTVLLGSAVPHHLVGTVDPAFYNHYSEIATVEANWGLHTLGRYDVGANIFDFVAKKTGDQVRVPENPPLSEIVLNSSYPGPFNTAAPGPFPVPNVKLVVNGRTVLPEIVQTWGAPALQKCTTYTDAVDVATGLNPPKLPAGC
jgi:acid phosphatase